MSLDEFRSYSRPRWLGPWNHVTKLERASHSSSGTRPAARASGLRGAKQSQLDAYHLESLPATVYDVGR